MPRQRQSLEITSKLKRISSEHRRRPPKRVQDLRRNVLVPAMKKARRDPRNKAHVHVSSDKLIINGKAYFHYNIPAGWLPSDRGDQEEEEEDEDTPALNDITGHTMVE